MPDIEYFYSVHSAFAYLGAARLMEIAKIAEVRIVHRPMNLGLVVRGAYPDGVAKRSQTNRNYYFGREIERWGEHRGVSFKGGIPDNHRNDVTLANCILIAGANQGHNMDQLAFALMQDHWLDHGDLADESRLARLIGAAGFDASDLFLAAKTDEIKHAYDANSAEAIARSVFGSPTYFVDGDMFFGQDHLELVERALAQPYAKTWIEI